MVIDSPECGGGGRGRFRMEKPNVASADRGGDDETERNEKNENGRREAKKGERFAPGWVSVGVALGVVGGGW